ncbi:PEPxxWA-CTERM sorting domain-containing protein, partial [Acinetobacter baumannii]|uniref:PEPxxWA-CTERM sorting domain-containing protein n=1 Tax=Acinetobacter baumannii TaxID=470 RepID=UPI00131C9772
DSLLTNRRVTISLTDSEASFAGVRFISATNSFELDNVVFAVPEASTWALMLVGFGMVGAATRYRRRKTNVAFS